VNYKGNLTLQKKQLKESDEKNKKMDGNNQQIIDEMNILIVFFCK